MRRSPLSVLCAGTALTLAIGLAGPAHGSPPEPAGRPEHTPPGLARAEQQSAGRQPQAHDASRGAGGRAAVDENTDTNDGVPNNVADAGDNRHPSGRDRSVEAGRSGNQGASTSDPDGMANGGPDKPGGTGGEDLADQDGNNGCGNDDDFEDDNNGQCSKRRPETGEEPAVAGEEPAVAGERTSRPVARVSRSRVAARPRSAEETLAATAQATPGGDVLAAAQAAPADADRPAPVRRTCRTATATAKIVATTPADCPRPLALTATQEAAPVAAPADDDGLPAEVLAATVTAARGVGELAVTGFNNGFLLVLGLLLVSAGLVLKMALEEDAPAIA